MLASTTTTLNCGTSEVAVLCMDRFVQLLGRRSGDERQLAATFNPHEETCMAPDSGISNRLTPAEEARDRAAHPPMDAPPHTVGDAPGAVAGAFGTEEIGVQGPDGLPAEVEDDASPDDDELNEDELAEDDEDVDAEVDDEPAEDE
jgi:hypothetical protein